MAKINTFKNVGLEYNNTRDLAEDDAPHLADGKPYLVEMSLTEKGHWRAEIHIFDNEISRDAYFILNTPQVAVIDVKQIHKN